MGVLFFIREEAEEDNEMMAVDPHGIKISKYVFGEEYFLL